MFTIFEVGDKVKITDDGIELIKEEPSFYGVRPEHVERLIGTEGRIVNMMIEESEDYFYDVRFGLALVLVERIGLGHLESTEEDKKES